MAGYQPPARTLRDLVFDRSSMLCGRECLVARIHVGVVVLGAERLTLLRLIDYVGGDAALEALEKEAWAAVRHHNEQPWEEALHAHQKVPGRLLLRSGTLESEHSLEELEIGQEGSRAREREAVH